MCSIYEYIYMYSIRMGMYGTCMQLKELCEYAMATVGMYNMLQQPQQQQQQQQQQPQPQQQHLMMVFWVLVLLFELLCWCFCLCCYC